MIASEHVYDALVGEGVTFFTGVPDSLLKPFCSCLYDRGHTLIAANEGAAVALATGYHLATGGIPLVYMQNSGLGNAINPLTSLTNPEVYGIPMVLMIGWRGAPGMEDEPQHRRPGDVMLRQLELLGVRSFVLDANTDDVRESVVTAVAEARGHSIPVALVVKEGTFQAYTSAGRIRDEQKEMSASGLDTASSGFSSTSRASEPITSPTNVASPAPSSTPAPRTHLPSREAMLEQILESLDPKDLIVATTGKTSREVYEIRVRRGEPHERDFLCVGNMGHASQIAMGIALHLPDRRVVCLDGDGALLMHMGSLAIQGAHAPSNYYHVLLNNGSHESVGGQPTVADGVNWPAMALACGYRTAIRLEGRGDAADYSTAVDQFMASPAPAFVEVPIRNGSRADLGRPSSSPKENKEAFMRNIAAENQTLNPS